MGKTFKDEKEIVEPKPKFNEEKGRYSLDYYELIEEELEVKPSENDFTFSKDDDIQIDNDILEKYVVHYA